MAQRTIAHLYDSYDTARTVVTELEAAGVPHDDISLVANAETQRAHTGTESTNAVAPAAGSGAVLGTALGGGVGLLAGLGALAIPGVGPVVAAGWLVATLTGAGVGAVSGGLIGSLTGIGISRDEADVYAEGVRGGGSLVTVRADADHGGKIEDIMGRHGPVDWRQRRESYGPDWKGFDENAAGRAPVYPQTTDGGVADPARRL